MYFPKSLDYFFTFIKRKFKGKDITVLRALSNCQMISGKCHSNDKSPEKTTRITNAQYRQKTVNNMMQKGSNELNTK